ncbi:hypothetical protein OSB04_017721 [Centaurea solstitialis]|uniref:Retroviral polymerase SH3-like domain-containing protein n=1 Tax=Centaurea solstitialis TaxID=347529 RepID=A0AA38TED9_9ASTR|nr:hypothetical protein OSB04_017721 [Centaurea solstitialis]
MLAKSNVPQKFWHIAFDTTTYLINRMPTRTNSNTSPFEIVFKHHPNYVFWVSMIPHLRSYNKHKLDFRSIPCVFLGYSTSHHGYRCLDPHTDRIYIARHVRFNEHYFPFTIPTPPPNLPLSTNPYYSSYPNQLPATFIQPPTTTPELIATPPSPTLPTPTIPPSPTPLVVTTPPTPPTPPTPTSIHTTPTHNPVHSNPEPTPPLRPPPSHLRQNPKPNPKYIASSFHTHPTHLTQNPPPLPMLTNILIDGKPWLMSIRHWCGMAHGPLVKRDQHGAIVRYKAWLVVKGFRQQPGVDYHETFSLC